ncbi:MAG: gamma-glutamyltransferase [Nitrospinota bacterium]|nr:MAG: gamma-glutamyltransferase [Nitrospinota bacterium]
MKQSNQLYQAHRPVVMGKQGMVATAHPLASQAGLRMLLEGGNAIDAAVAAAATLNVVEPYMSGVGGIGVLLCYLAREGQIRVLNFSGRAPYAATPDRYTPETKQVGLRSPLVPGNVAGWLTLLETYGSMERSRVLAPAITYAEHGAPVSYKNHRFIKENIPLLSRFPTSAQVFLPNGKAPRPGSLLSQPALAQSLRLIAEGGKEVFYRGELAERMVRFVQEQDGLLTLQDLADYEARWEEPITTTYRGYHVHVPPPNSSAFQMLATLNILEQFDLSSLGYGSPRLLHLLMEAIKLSVTDRIRYAGDPDHTSIPLRGLLSKEYALSQQRRIDWQQASVVSGERYSREPAPESLRSGIPEEYTAGLTTHLAAADGEGNVVTITQTLGNAFGCGVLLGDSGIFLNNMAYWFEIDPDSDSPNLIAPWKRVDFCVAPMQVLHKNAFLLSLGTPGSYGILQTTVQMLLNLLDFGMNIQEAIEAPRFRYYEGRRVQMERRFPIEVRKALQELGHQVEVIDEWSWTVGGGQGIWRDPESGVWQGGADPRRDGYAVGF